MSNPRETFVNHWLEENKLQFKAQLYNSDLPSFPRRNSYLDICIIDCRILLETKNNAIEIIPYDSDHNAISINVFKINNCLLELESQEVKENYQLNTADWSKYRKNLSSWNNITIPNNRNLNNQEIESYIGSINSEIIEALNKSVPKRKNVNRNECYRNETIFKLPKQKSRLLTYIHRLQKEFDTQNIDLLHALHRILLNIRPALKQEFTNSVNKY